MKVDLNSSLSQKIVRLKTDTALSIVKGDYKRAREAHKELASIGVDNFELTVNTQSPAAAEFSLFSKEGFRAFVFVLSEMFRKKTPDEIKFAKMLKKYEKEHTAIEPLF